MSVSPISSYNSGSYSLYNPSEDPFQFEDRGPSVLERDMEEESFLLSDFTKEQFPIDERNKTSFPSPIDLSSINNLAIPILTPSPQTNYAAKSQINPCEVKTVCPDILKFKISALTANTKKKRKQFIEDMVTEGHSYETVAYELDKKRCRINSNMYEFKKKMRTKDITVTKEALQAQAEIFNRISVEQMFENLRKAKANKRVDEKAICDFKKRIARIRSYK